MAILFGLIVVICAGLIYQLRRQIGRVKEIHALYSDPAGIQRVLNLSQRRAKMTDESMLNWSNSVWMMLKQNEIERTGYCDLGIPIAGVSFRHWFWLVDTLEGMGRLNNDIQSKENAEEMHLLTSFIKKGVPTEPIEKDRRFELEEMVKINRILEKYNVDQLDQSTFMKSLIALEIHLGLRPKIE